MSPNPFSPTSRYSTTELSCWTTPNGKTVVYLCRRRLPDPDELVTLVEHRVSEGDRLDNVTAQYLGDPEQFWRICDANNVLVPDELTDAVGRIIRITLPEGIPGPRNA